MGVFLSLLRNDMRIIFHGWKTMLLLLLLPVLMLVTVAVALVPMRDSSVFIEPFSIALVDQESSVWTAMLSRQLEGVTLVSEVVRVEEEEAVRLIREGKLAAAIVIPPDLSDQLSLLAPASATIYGSSQFSLQSNLVRHLGQIGADIVSSGIASIETIRRLSPRYGMPEEALYPALDRVFEAFFSRVLGRRSVFTEPPSKSMALSLVEYYGAGLLAVFLLFASLPCMKRLATDRQNGVHRRLRSTSMPAWMPVASLWLVSLTVSALQFTLLVVVLSMGFNAWWGVPPWQTFLLFLGTVMASAGFSMLVASLADTPVTVDLVGNLGVLVMAVVGGSLYPPTAMPDWVRPLSALTVVRWSREGFLGVFSGNASEIARSTNMLFVLAASFLAVAVLANHFRKERG